jgi:hypothetical protein
LRYAEAERERDELYDKFEAMVRWLGGVGGNGQADKGRRGARMQKAVRVFKQAAPVARGTIVILGANI